MRELLLINPNTSDSVTALLRDHVQAGVGPAVAVRAVSARLGAPYIACEASYAVAAHATLDAWATALAEGAKPDAVLIGCFGDPGLFALQDSSKAPVTGLAAAAFGEAARHGRFAVVTGGERWKPMLMRLAHALGHGDSLAGVETVKPSGAELAADPAMALALLAAACRDAVSRWRVDAIIIGGAGLAGMAARLQPALDVPLIDSVQAGARQALQAVAGSKRRDGFDVPWTGLSAAMLAFGKPQD